MADTSPQKRRTTDPSPAPEYLYRVYVDLIEGDSARGSEFVVQFTNRVHAFEFAWEQVQNWVNHDTVYDCVPQRIAKNASGVYKCNQATPDPPPDGWHWYYDVHVETVSAIAPPVEILSENTDRRDFDGDYSSLPATSVTRSLVFP